MKSCDIMLGSLVFGVLVWVPLTLGSLNDAHSFGKTALKGGRVYPQNLAESQYPPFKGCKKDLMKFQWKASDISYFKINLDDPPEQRWSEVVKHKSKELGNLVTSIKNNTNEIFGVEVFELVDKYLPLLAKSLPKEYYNELVGISKATQIPLGEVTLFNVFYEFFSVCTSIIMEGNDGDMYHGRNLDFGLFLGWDIKNNTWLTSEYLRPLVLRLDFFKSKKLLYSSIHFAGYIGVLTGVKKNAFSLTINERFKLSGGYIGVAEWLLGERNLQWVGLLTREVFLNADSYKAAQKMLINAPLIAPVYFILAGNKSHQGCIITRGHKDHDILSLGDQYKRKNDTWFLVQTNYDHWKNPPFYDDRRTPSVICMEKFGRTNPLKTLANVLSTRPVLNKLTTYTALMKVKSGEMHVQLQNCQDPCWPW